MGSLIRIIFHVFAVATTFTSVTCNSVGFSNSSSLIIPASSNSSQVISVGPVRSEIECLSKCPLDQYCIAARFNTETGACDVAKAYWIHRAPSGSLAGVNLSADRSNKLWLHDDVNGVLHRLSNPPPRTTFRNSSTGRNGIIQMFTVPTTACYTIQAFGARGGSHWTVYDGSPSTTFPPKYWLGGLGAYKAGRFQLSEGTQLSIVVGQSGGNSTEMTPGYPTFPEDKAGTGGGGGSFVYRTSDNYLYLAAGGGGGGSNDYQGVVGQSGTSGTSSSGSSASFAGGANGDPGTTNPASASYHGGPGAGWNGNFATARAGAEHGDRGGGRTDGWVGGVAGGMNSGAVGGFGGGGGGGEDNGASGGGGGYSGGGAGTFEKHAGGGGGSFCAGVACEGTTGGNTVSDQGRIAIYHYGETCS